MNIPFSLSLSSNCYKYILFLDVLNIFYKAVIFINTESLKFDFYFRNELKCPSYITSDDCVKMGAI